jgi:hypothetical protein
MANEFKNLDGENCRLFLAAFIEKNKIITRKVAKVIGCSEPTLNRILVRKTLPSDEMIRQSGIMMELGYKSYSKLSKADKEKISEAIGTLGGGSLGFASITAVISSLGISGLSAAGIASGLATLGAVVSGGMVAGVLITATIPIAAGVVGYGLIKGIKKIVENSKLNIENYDPFWERPLEDKG